MKPLQHGVTQLSTGGRSERVGGQATLVGDGKLVYFAMRKDGFWNLWAEFSRYKSKRSKEL
jgi:hypothetical protein